MIRMWVQTGIPWRVLQHQSISFENEEMEYSFSGIIFKISLLQFRNLGSNGAGGER